jgi:hypothetical protein
MRVGIELARRSLRNSAVSSRENSSAVKKRNAPETCRARKKEGPLSRNDRRNKSEDQKKGLHLYCSVRVCSCKHGGVDEWEERVRRAPLQEILKALRQKCASLDWMGLIEPRR